MRLLPIFGALPASPAVPPPNRLSGWERPLRVEAPGTRVAMIVEATDDRPVALLVQDGAR